MVLRAWELPRHRVYFDPLMSHTHAVLLAAGKGTRMGSDLPKVLHPLRGQPMILYSVQTARAVSGHPPVMVIGHGAEQVREVVGDRAEYVVQRPQLGTAHAVQQAETLLAGRAEWVLITSGDMPLLSEKTLKEMVQQQQENRGPLSLLTVVVEDPRGFGRIVRGPGGEVLAVVEEKAAKAEQLAIRELNVGAYCASGEWLWQALRQIPLSAVGEYYLTDLVAVAVGQGHRVLALEVNEPGEAIGINTPEHLREAEALMSKRNGPEFEETL